MNIKRLPYFGLTKIETPVMGTPSLCHFCKYSRWNGNCKEADLSCEHPLNKTERWEPFDVWAGRDCWGFRPDVDIDLAADMVGVWLNGHTVQRGEAQKGTP